MMGGGGGSIASWLIALVLALNIFISLLAVKQHYRIVIGFTIAAVLMEGNIPNFVVLSRGEIEFNKAVGQQWPT